MKKITLLFTVLGIILISSGNLYSQTKGKKAGTKKETKQEINSSKKPGEPVKGAEVFEEQEKSNSSNGNNNEQEEKNKKQGKKQGKSKAKKREKSTKKMDTSNCI